MVGSISTKIPKIPGVRNVEACSIFCKGPKDIAGESSKESKVTEREGHLAPAWMFRSNKETWIFTV